MKPILDDDVSCEDYRKANRKRGKSTEEQEQEVIYKVRCRIVSLSHNYPMMVDYIRKNEHIISKMDRTAKECMRRTCQDSLEHYSMYYSPDDVALFDRVFGLYVPANLSRTIFEDMAHSQAVDDTPRTLDEQVVAYTYTTYQTFIEWLNDPIIQSQLSERPDLYERVAKAIEVNRVHNYVVASGRGFREYHPDDEVLFTKVLDSMRVSS